MAGYYSEKPLATYDDRPLNAFFDSLQEDYLIEAIQENPNDKKIVKEIEEWEAKYGRKLGDVPEFEKKLRQAAFDMDVYNELAYSEGRIYDC
jgi:hypothetical protein